MSNKVLGEVAKGAGIIFLGTLFAYLFKFIFRILVSRFFGPENFGLFSIGDMLLNIGLLLSLLGLSSGIVKFISHYFALGHTEKAKGAFFGSLKISIILSIIISGLFIIFAKEIAILIFNNSDLVNILIVFSLTIPIYAVLTIVSNTLLALKKPHYHFWSFSIGRNLVILLLTILVILLGGTILHIAVVYLVSFAVGVLLAFYFLEKKVFSFFSKKIYTLYDYKTLLKFSLPLFFSGLFVSIMGWADTFFLGMFKNAFDVGVYNVAMPLAASLAMFLSAFANIFYPIMSGLYAKGEIRQLNETYTVVLRWLFMLSFPVVLIIALFPSQVLRILFGTDYVLGSSVLVILILANFISVITGPCEHALMVFDRTKLIFYLNVAATLLNLVLNIVLIPSHGIIGAAIATALALVVRKIIFFFLTRRMIKFSLNFIYYLKYFFAAAIPLTILYFIVNYLVGFSSILLLILGVVLFLGFYVLFLLLFKAFSKEDFIIMLAIERKSGLNLGRIKSIIGRFL